MDPLTSILTLAGVSAAALGGLALKKDEGFQTLTDPSFQQYTATGASRYNNLSQILNPFMNALTPLAGTPAQVAAAQAQVVRALGASAAVPQATGQTLAVTPPTTNLVPRADDGSGLLGTIEFCNRKGADMDPFSDTRFAQNCGVCIRAGVDEKGNAFKGRKGLYISPAAKQQAEQKKVSQNLFFIPAAPSLARCDGAPDEPTFATNTADLVRFRNRENCRQNKTLSAGCGKCFEEENYTYVGTAPPRATVNLVVQGQGSYYITVGSRWFRGTLSTQPANLVVGTVAEGTPMVFTVESTTTGSLTNNPQIAGVLTATLPNQSLFTMPIDRLLTIDTVTQQKPRLTGQVVPFPAANLPVPVLQAGRNKTKMVLTGNVPFTFVQTGDFSTMDCAATPFQTKQESLTQPVANPCYKSGQTAGAYSDECLRQVILDNGCTNQGKLFAIPSQLNMLNGAPQTLSDIVTRVQNIAKQDGFLNTESQQCSGRTVDTPCQPYQQDSGVPISAECLSLLYNNTGSTKPSLGSTYSATTNYQNQTTAQPNLFCTSNGALNPILPGGSLNAPAISALQQVGLSGFSGKRGVEAVKAFLNDQLKIAIDPNKNAYTDSVRNTAVKNCFGQVSSTANSKPEVFAVGPGYDYSLGQAPGVCAKYGARVATDGELATAQSAGADWCFTAWLADVVDPKYPITTSLQGGCGGGRKGVMTYKPPTNKAGVTCYGIKPGSGTPGVLNFAQGKWSQFS